VRSGERVERLRELLFDVRGELHQLVVADRGHRRRRVDGQDHGATIVGLVHHDVAGQHHANTELGL
jgi:hypothetical protein